MSSKTSEEEIEGSDILPMAIEFVESSYFESKIEDFLSKNCSLVDIDAKTGEMSDMSVEYMDIFQKYQELIDDLLGEFAVSKKLDLGEVYTACRDAADGKFTALFEENENKWFVDMLMSWMNFEDFFAKIHRFKKRFERQSSSKSKK